MRTDIVRLAEVRDSSVSAFGNDGPGVITGGAKCRVGTSISTRASRARNRTAATAAVGAAGASIRNALDGRWVTTIVFSNPIRRAIHAAPKWDSTLTIVPSGNVDR